MYPMKIYIYFIFERAGLIFTCGMSMFWLKIPCSFHYNIKVPEYIRGTVTTSFYGRYEPTVKQERHGYKMDILQILKEELQVEKWQVEAAVKLIDEGNTIPFISRYRKEVTGPKPFIATFTDIIFPPLLILFSASITI